MFSVFSISCKIFIEFCNQNQVLKLVRSYTPPLWLQGSSLVSFFPFFLWAPQPPKVGCRAGLSPAPTASPPHSHLWWCFLATSVVPNAPTLFLSIPPCQASRIDHKFDLKPCGPHLNLAKIFVPFSVKQQEIQVLIEAYWLILWIPSTFSSLNMFKQVK